VLGRTFRPLAGPDGWMALFGEGVPPSPDAANPRGRDAGTLAASRRMRAAREIEGCNRADQGSTRSRPGPPHSPPIAGSLVINVPTACQIFHASLGTANGLTGLGKIGHSVQTMHGAQPLQRTTRNVQDKDKERDRHACPKDAPPNARAAQPPREQKRKNRDGGKKAQPGAACAGNTKRDYLQQQKESVAPQAEPPDPERLGKMLKEKTQRGISGKNERQKGKHLRSVKADIQEEEEAG